MRSGQPLRIPAGGLTEGGLCIDAGGLEEVKRRLRISAGGGLNAVRQGTRGAGSGRETEGRGRWVVRRRVGGAGSRDGGEADIPLQEAKWFRLRPSL